MQLQFVSRREPLPLAGPQANSYAAPIPSHASAICLQACTACGASPPPTALPSSRPPTTSWRLWPPRTVRMHCALLNQPSLTFSMHVERGCCAVGQIRQSAFAGAALPGGPHSSALSTGLAAVQPAASTLAQRECSPCLPCPMQAETGRTRATPKQRAMRVVLLDLHCRWCLACLAHA